MFRIALVIALLMPGVALAQSFHTVMDVDQATTCSVSDSRGEGFFTFDAGTKLFTYNITFGDNAADFDNGVLTGGAETVSHIHVGAPGVAGGVDLNLPLGNPKVGSATLDAGQEANLLAGLWYVNVHSAACGLGEIRGQLAVGMPSLPGAFLWMGAGALGLLAGLWGRRKSLY